MAQHATHADAELLLKLYDLRREEKMRAARAWFVGQCKVKTYEEWQALCPLGSETNAYFRMVTTYWEMACSFVASGVLHPELFIQNNLEHLLVYERIAGILPALRAANKNPIQLRNLETVAGVAVAWLGHEAPGMYEAFRERYRP